MYAHCRSYAFALFTWLLIHSAATAASPIQDGCQILNTKSNETIIKSSTSQIIMVKSLGGIDANVTLCQKQTDIWHSVFTHTFHAVIGKNGLAAVGTKKEGDLKTPAGLYPIGEAFGTRTLALKMDYRYITADDKFIDDIHHPSYNQWVSGPTEAKSYESMLIKPYALGLVVNYNRNPTVQGAGSAIFIHLWRSPHSPTAGCIALDKKQLLTILHWLDKNQHPYILIDE